MASTPMQEIGEVFLSTTHKGQEIVLEAIQTWMDTFQAFTPTMPSVNVQFADWLPNPKDVVTNAYDFAAQVLASQKKFAEDVLKTTTPLLPAAN